MTHGAGGTYPISQPSVLPSPVIHTDLSAAQLGMIWKQVTIIPLDSTSILLFISNRKRFHLSMSV